MKQNYMNMWPIGPAAERRRQAGVGIKAYRDRSPTPNDARINLGESIKNAES